MNDNDAPVPAISFTDLAAGLGVDEDTLLERLAGILQRREAPRTGADPDEASKP